MPVIAPHFWYARDAEEAARFYVSIFPDSRIDNVVALAGETPGGAPGSVIVLEFTLCGRPFMAISAGPHHDFNDAISMHVTCEDQAEIDLYWDALLEGGGQPVQCGWLRDRYGVSWQVAPRRLGEMMGSPDRAAAGRATKAMLGMVKMDLAALETAYAGG